MSLSTKLLLLLCSTGLVPIALGYGLVPEISMPLLYDVDASSISLKNILRAIMMLYLFLAGLWFYTLTLNHSLEKTSLISIVLFMISLAIGRVINILVDGIPSILLIIYLVLELFFGIWAIIALKQI